MIRTEEKHLAHYGILRRSGRYPWGSGGTQSKRNKSYLDTISNLHKEGMSQAEIAKAYGITVKELRAAKSIAIAQQRQEKILTAQRLQEKGWSNSEIGRRMNLNESSVRALLAPGAKDKADALQSTANVLRDQVNQKKMVDVGKGVEAHLGVTSTRLDNAVAVLKEEGYTVHNIDVQQLGTGKFTKTKVLALPGTKLSEVQRNRAQIQLPFAYSNDHGRTYLKTQPPISLSSKRVAVRYGNEGGKEADGMIFVRRGVEDLSIGGKNYGQVRIAVDGTHYLKGMVVYKDDLPDGVDIMFNTNKLSTGNKKDVMKPISDDPDYPFGAIVRQVHDENGKVSSVMNIVGSPTKEGSGVEGNWDTWSKNLSSQMLSKQSPDLAKQQLNVTFERRMRELNEINSLTNPTVKRELLLKFADQTDAAAVHLKAASLPRQATRVILPVPSMKRDEVYAPSFRDGERVALVRYPHGGTFEIPQLTVNNRNREAKRLLGTQAEDSIGIHHSVAQRLSGADFDGDTVIVIPNNKGLVKSTPALESLKDFDPQVYKIPEGSPIPKVTDASKQREMGRVSNLITDMTLHGASSDEVSRAVRHSMVVIDSEKHQLDYKQSEKDHGIPSLKEKYQGGKTRGASTIISRAGSRADIPERVERPARRGGPIDPATGRKVFEPTGRMVPVMATRVVDGKRVRVETGEFEPKLQRFKKLAVTDDARELVSKPGTRVEFVYADHSNKLKAMANSARKEAVSIKSAPYSPSAKKTYAGEVASLNAKLNIAKRNAPLERQAQLIANTRVSQKRQANPHMEKDELKKIKQKELNDARITTGAGKDRIKITQSEWNAIQAGAISNHRLEEIFRNADTDSVKALALPKDKILMTSTMKSRAQRMLADGYTQIEVADALGVGLTTLKVGISE